MNINNKYLFVGLMIFGFFSCSKAPNQDSTENKTEVVGTYEGVIPCADCSGIMVTMNLQKDNTYTLSRTYLDTKKDKFVEKGMYNTKNNKIVLHFGKDSTQYSIGDRDIEMLDINGEKIESRLNYKLLKK